jgi:hypothetical protein
MSSPSDYPRVYICDECIAVCDAVLEDDRGEQPSGDEAPPQRPFQDHPLIPKLLFAVEEWARCPSESPGAIAKLARVSAIATRVVRETEGRKGGGA